MHTLEIQTSEQKQNENVNTNQKRTAYEEYNQTAKEFVGESFNLDAIKTEIQSAPSKIFEIMRSPLKSVKTKKNYSYPTMVSMVALPSFAASLTVGAIMLNPLAAVGSAFLGAFTAPFCLFATAVYIWMVASYDEKKIEFQEACELGTVLSVLSSALVIPSMLIRTENLAFELLLTVASIFGNLLIASFLYHGLQSRFSVSKKVAKYAAMLPIAASVFAVLGLLGSALWLASLV